MINDDHWPDADERREAADGETHLFEQLAAACGLNPSCRRNERILDVVYRLYQGYAVRDLPTKKRVRNTKLAQQGNIARGIRSLLAVRTAVSELSLPHKPRPRIKQIARRAASILKDGKQSLSIRHTQRLIKQMRAADGDPGRCFESR